MAKAQDPVAVVRTMWEAFDDGRMDDVIATMHPDVVWTPLTRPGISLYVGHEGIRQARQDITGVHGQYRTEVDTYSRLGEGIVIAEGVVVVHNDGEEPLVKLAFEAECIVRDGLIASIDSREIVRDAPLPNLNTRVSLQGRDS